MSVCGQSVRIFNTEKNIPVNTFFVFVPLIIVTLTIPPRASHPACGLCDQKTSIFMAFVTIFSVNGSRHSK